MKKISAIFMCSVLCAVGAQIYAPTVANAAAPRASDNPMFGPYRNQISLYVGWGSDSSRLYPDFNYMVPFGIVQLQYSQPIAFLRLPSRVNITGGYTFGWGKSGGENWRDYSHLVASLSWDAAFLNWRGFYLGAGLGIAMKSGMDARQDSRVMFTPRAFLGYRIADRWGAELFFQHYSDGNLTPVNAAYNFVGIGTTYSF
ncbi:MAG: acyloxyacyl hydrolase [Proteobacteria bacterium]|nr:acyloxyacyl hydrolase [Pseudomonadota bacterium]